MPCPGRGPTSGRGMFVTNTLSWAPSIRAEGVVRQPFPDSTAAPLHEVDIAAVAVAALLDPGAARGAGSCSRASRPCSAGPP